MQAFSAQGPLSMSVERILSPGDQGLSKSVRLQEPSASQSRCKGLGEKVRRYHGLRHKPPLPVGGKTAKW